MHRIAQIRRAAVSPSTMRMLVSLALAAGAPAGCRQAETDPAEAAPVRPTATENDGARRGSMDSIFDSPASHGATRLAVSALSRINRASGRARPSIDLRLDATDDRGAPARIGGDLRVKVIAPGSAPERLVFGFSMRTKAEADRRYDPTLEQYVLRLEPDWQTLPAAGSTLDLEIELTTAAGQVLRASGSIEW